MYLDSKKKLCLAAAILFAVNILLICAAQSVGAAGYQKGASGQKVTEIQTKLKNWGYYDGTVDGVFGSGTEKAVKKFQQKNGLTADGKVGPATLAALGISGQSGGR